MKHIMLSTIAFLTVSTFLLAGGNIVPDETIEVENTVNNMVNNSSGFYVGVAYTAIHNEVDITSGRYGEVDYDGYMLQTGYKFNPYLAVEARYWDTWDEEITTTHPIRATATLPAQMDAWGIYLKPMYPIMEKLDVYALLGWGHQDSKHGSYHPEDSSFSWGGGASYSFTENISFFVDYVRIYDDTAIDNTVNLFGEVIDVNLETSSFNVGLSYKF